jgi:hypothetical protein
LIARQKIPADLNICGLTAIILLKLITWTELHYEMPFLWK